MLDTDRWWPSRYGEGDELGTLNEITPSGVVAAARLVREGTVYDLGRVLHAGVPSFPGRFWQQTLVSGAHLSNPRRPGGEEGGWGRNQVNWITELVTGTFQMGTQVDGLNHLQIGDRFYNGWRARDIVEEWGTSKLGIETVPPVIARGVLADVARYRGVGRLDAGYVISVEDLEATLGSQGVTIGLNDYYWGADDFEYPLGHIQTLGKSHTGELEGDAPSLRIPGVEMTLEYMAHHSVDWWLTTEDLPDRDNRVTLRADGGIMLSYTPNNLEPHKRLHAKLRHAMEHVEGGMTHFLPRSVYLRKQIPIAGVAHQNGTCRFGTDPRSSVLDLDCKAHDLDNLYVVDASFFPSSTSSNPSLTIIANALRVGDHLLERLGAAGGMREAVTADGRG